jgi:aspartate dehydrogenase
MRKISIVGCGTIGSEVAMAVDRDAIPMQLMSLYDVDREKAVALRQKLRHVVPGIAATLTEVVSASDLVFEATHVNSLKQIAEESFRLRKDMFVMSVGGLVVYPEILETAKAAGRKIYFPSGAIAGLDAVGALRLSGIKAVTLKSTKPLKSLISSPGLTRFLQEKKMTVEDIQQAETVFEGNVREAVPLFPQNVNISAALALQGIGPEETRVVIVADPWITRNVHEITCVSEAGTVYTKTDNLPHPENPKTTYLAILSAVARLREL